jgi:hypothetical protein
MTRSRACRERSLVATIAMALILAGCGAGLRPAADATVPEGVRTATTTTAGVEIVATADAWRWWPHDLTRLVTPIHVVIANRGEIPLRVRHTDFGLVVAARRLSATPPSEIRGIVYEPPPPALPRASFGLGAEGYAGEPDWVLGGAAFGAWSDPVTRPGDQFSLPTPDVLERALPEGTLEPGHSMSGFLYFERPPVRTRRAEVAGRLVAEPSGEPLGTVLLPLRLR